MVIWNMSNSLWSQCKTIHSSLVPYKWLFFIIFFFVGVYVELNSDDSQQSTAATYSPEVSSIESNKRAGTVSAGDAVVLKWSDSERAGHLAIDETAWDAMFEAINAKDTMGLTELVQSGQVHEVRSGTRAKVLFSGFTRHTVKLMDEPSAGVEGWVVREFVQR